MEQRRTQRLKIEIPATFKITNQQEHVSIGTTLNISATGLCLQTKERLTPGQDLAISLNLPSYEKVTMNVRVIWVQETDFSLTSDYLIGIKITESLKSEEVKFIKYYVSQLLDFYKK